MCPIVSPPSLLLSRPIRSSAPSHPAPVGLVPVGWCRLGVAPDLVPVGGCTPDRNDPPPPNTRPQFQIRKDTPQNESFNCFLSSVPLLSRGWIVPVGGATPDRQRPTGSERQKFHFNPIRRYNSRRRIVADRPSPCVGRPARYKTRFSGKRQGITLCDYSSPPGGYRSGKNRKESPRC